MCGTKLETLGPTQGRILSWCTRRVARWSLLAYLVRAQHGYEIGDDQGMFSAALRDLRTYGGVLEHPKHSRAWKAFGLLEPKGCEWSVADWDGLWTAEVCQAHYGHFVRKPTWLLANRCMLPSLKAGPGPRDTVSEPELYMGIGAHPQ